MNRYEYRQGECGAWVQPYYCNNCFCEPDCDCGLTFEEAKALVIEYYKHQLEKAKKLTEEDYYK